MASGKRICKVCGKEYDYCKTNRPTDVFRYQDVACSKECGDKYFADVMKARGLSYENNTVEESESLHELNPVSDNRNIANDDEELFEDAITVFVSEEEGIRNEDEAGLRGNDF